MYHDVTQDMIQKVREYECSMNGHRWDTIEEISYEFPLGAYCNHCGTDSKLMPRTIFETQILDLKEKIQRLEAQEWKSAL